MVARKQLEFEILVKMLGLSFSENWGEQAKRFWTAASTCTAPPKKWCVRWFDCTDLRRASFASPIDRLAL